MTKWFINNGQPVIAWPAPWRGWRTDLKPPLQHPSIDLDSAPTLERTGTESRPVFDSDPLIGELISERYRVQSVLGHGGMGTVYLAEHVLMEKQVALKVLHPSLAVVSSVMDRFQKEAIALSRIDHPNVVSATDFGKLKNGAYYLTLQYIEGPSLADVIDAEGKLSVHRSMTIASQMAQALSAAHSHKIVHRDLKPQNVMLAPTADGSELVKVLDFGLAKLRSRDEESNVTTGSVLGTPHYMAPEQVTGAPVDHRADVYALGVILYEMLTGNRPFDSQDVRELMSQQVTQPAPALPESIPREVRQIVECAMKKSPDDRFQDAEEMLAEIDAYLRPPITISEFPATPDPFLKRPVSIAGFEVPTWGLLLPAGVFLLLFILGIVRSIAVREPVAGPVDVPERAGGINPTPPSLAPEPDRWPSLISDAEFGKKEAIDELLRIPPDKRGKDVWLVLGRGQMVRKRTDDALDLYRDAIHNIPELADDESVAKNVYIATTASRTAQKAVTVAAESLGTRGVDILFNVWSTTSKRTPASALAERYMDQEKVRKKASPQVLLALKLRETDKLECEQVLELVKQAKEYGDTRCLRPLWQLKSQAGCGPTKRDDCYPCLRDGKLLAQATKKAAKRLAPEY